ncbi:unnamed protein product [marine sediment metagenome]|uniref:Uncharacterized protein n=1 Tax=marine sediment metagenome TaxID=412755 RepID=X1TI11_9ZZZZ
MKTIDYSLQSIDFFFRINKNKGLLPTKYFQKNGIEFVEFDNTPLNDPSLSMDAIGLMTTFLSKSFYDLFSIHEIFLWSSDTHKTTAFTLIELVDSGYLEIFKIYYN